MKAVFVPNLLRDTEYWYEIPNNKAEILSDVFLRIFFIWHKINLALYFVTKVRVVISVRVDSCRRVYFLFLFARIATRIK